jgi:uncharacterized protein YdeI (YjbR/CyaY-like superfamily)
VIVMARQATKPAARVGENFDHISVDSRAALRKWLSKNHKRKTSVWCVTWKKQTGAAYVPYSDVVEEALRFGWIDSLPRALDEARTMLLLSPRKPDSNWSRLNKERAERLIAQGKMTAAGLAIIETAKKNGRWDVLNDVDSLTVPSDLEAALKSRAQAKANWEQFPRSARRGILEWITNAKTPETRARRIEETAIQAGKNIRANQYRQKLPGTSADPSARNSGKTRKSVV